MRKAADLPRSGTGENDCAAAVLEVAILLPNWPEKPMLM